MSQRTATRFIALAAAFIWPAPLHARSLEDALASTFASPVPAKVSTEVDRLPRVFAASVAASFPVTGTSASYVYRFDPATDSFERLNVPLGPVFSERGQTSRPGKLSLALNYVLVQYDTINGDDLSALTSRAPQLPGHLVICRDPAHMSGCEPVMGRIHLDLEAQIVALSATYGITPDLDVNVFLPVVRTSLRASTEFTGPDPRAPANPAFQPFPFTAGGSATEATTGVGDLLLRLKYVFARPASVDLAGGLTVSLPTGSRADFQGTGDTAVGAAVYASRTFAERIEPHLNLGFVVDTAKFDRSQVRYSVGADVRLFDWLTLNNDFLGRSDVRQPDTIDQPAFVQIERADVLQFSTGLKVAPLAHAPVLFFNALLPLNRDGVRADRVLAFGIESVF